MGRRSKRSRSVNQRSARPIQTPRRRQRHQSLGASSTPIRRRFGGCLPTTNELPDRRGIQKWIKRKVKQSSAPFARFQANRSIEQSEPVEQQLDELELQRRSLPIYLYRDNLTRELSRSSAAIVVGETGSGKSTQIVQYLYQFGLQRLFASKKPLKLIITQPRRVAAISLATRVAQEMRCDLGGLVGYCVRFDECLSESTRIVFMTDGMLLRKITVSPLLPDVGMIVLDEAHERSIHTDMLLGIVRKLRALRELQEARTAAIAPFPLRLLLMSATMDVEPFREYFGNCAVYFVEGRQHPVDIFFSETTHDDYTHATLVTVFQIHRTYPLDGGILCFLTGQDEIEAAVQQARIVAQHLPHQLAAIDFLPLYSSMPRERQLAVFQPPSRNRRRVIFATNVAESSLTIPGVRYVVDSGRAKVRERQSGSSMERLHVEPISKAQAQQRSGRAGRLGAGICFRLYATEEFERWPDHPRAEIERCGLSLVLLHLFALGVNEPRKFHFLTAPQPEAIDSAYRELEALGAIRSAPAGLPRRFVISKRGRQMIRFPLDPRYSRCIIEALEVGAATEVLAILSMLSVDGVFASTGSGESKACHRKYDDISGDPLVLLNIWRAYSKGARKSATQLQKWCRDQHLISQNLRQAALINRQLTEIAVRIQNENSAKKNPKAIVADDAVDSVAASISNVHLNAPNHVVAPDSEPSNDNAPTNLSSLSHSNDSSLIRRCLSRGFFFNAARLELGKELSRSGFGAYRTLDGRHALSIHPSSALFAQGHRPQMIMFDELTLTSRLYARNCFVADPAWLTEVELEYHRAASRRKIEETGLTVITTPEPARDVRNSPSPTRRTTPLCQVGFT